MAKNVICLWYDGTAEDAAKFYAKTFPNSAVTAVHTAPGDYPAGKQGQVLTVDMKDFPTEEEQYEMYVRTQADILEDHKTVRNEKLQEFFLSESDPDTTTRVLLDGDPSTQIAQYAKENHFDLIMMPTHSGRFRQTLLGSTTARVINDAPCPVMTSRHAETIAPRPEEEAADISCVPEYNRT